MSDKRREPARWIFSSEMRECNSTINEGEGEYSREFFVTPGGSMGRRVLFCGKLNAKTEEGDMTKMTVADPTGAFYVTFFSKDFNQNVKEDISKVQVGDEIMTMGRTSFFRTDEGKLYVNINPESVTRVSSESVDYWISRTSFLLRRRIMAIREVRNNPEASIESLMGKGFSQDEAKGVMESQKIYGSYDIQKLEEIAISVNSAKPSENVIRIKDEVASFIGRFDPLGGISYNEIMAEFRKRNIPDSDIDEAINTLWHDAEIYEVEKRKFKTA
ncbi:hypothetical protein ACNF40_02700 [Cuniculiplasma sp. SKW4]|uniref:hypothetical protein n=1 Tax=Cuniculiplasma sp. SKW4 TaxID=3400171 RepID=UPI003FD4E62A